MDTQQIYEDLMPERDRYLERGRMAARYTVPYFYHLCDPNSFLNHDHQVETPWNSIGTQGIHRLATKLMLHLLPPNEPFFRLTIDEIEWAIARQGADPSQAKRDKAEFDSALSVIERAQINDIAASNDRTALYEALQHLLIVGNILMFVGEDSLENYHLRDYVLKRDADGTPYLSVIKETKVPSLLPEAAYEIWSSKFPEQQEQSPAWHSGDIRAEIFTRVEWDTQNCRWWQEICREEIPGTRGSVKKEESPWLPLRMIAISGSDYSPGYVESHALGDLHTVDQLTEAIVSGSLASARHFWGVKTSCPISPRDIAKKRSGETIPVNSESDIFCIQAKMGNDLQVASSVLSSIETRVSAAFSLLQVRDSERTTQAEVTLAAQERDETFASLYMILQQEFCYPYVLAKFALLKRRLPQVFDLLAENLVRPIVSVGLSAIGRGNDLERIAMFARVAKELFGPGVMEGFTHPGRLFNQLAVASNLPSLDAILTEGEVEERQQGAEQQRQQEMQLRLAEIAARSPMMDPQKQANAEATIAGMGAPPDAGPPAAPPMPQQ